MFTPSNTYSASRPFRIFVSLLDKWEIGSTLSDVLIMDCLQGIKQQMQDSTGNDEDVGQVFRESPIWVLSNVGADDHDCQYPL